MTDQQAAWPELPLAEWQDTYQSLHMWLQIVGKVRLAASPWVNHSWHVTFYVTARGLTTSPIPIDTRTFQVDFDFIDQRLAIKASDGREGGFVLEPMSVAVFYARLMKELATLDIRLRSICCRTRSKIRSARLDEKLERTTPNTPSGSGARCAGGPLCSKFPRRIYRQGKSVHFFGAHRTWQSRDFRAARATASGRYRSCPTG